MKTIKVIVTLALATLLFFSLMRLQGNITRFGVNSVQVDFSVYYTAGQNLLAHVPLYKNGIVLDPMLWDGLDRYVHSRYLYPPLAAVPFELIAAVMPYGIAKVFWMYFSLACLLASIIITIRTLKLRLRFWQYAVIGIYTASFFPLLTSLERGQIDAMTLLLALTAASLAVNRHRREIVSGFLWAFATLIKLHIGFVALFFVVRKQWKMLWGYLLGGVAIIALTALFLGPASVADYVTKEFPRIARHGEAGPSELKLPDTYFEKYYSAYAPGSTSGLFKDGRFYPGVPLSFAWNASLPRFISMRLADMNAGWQFGPSILSLILVALFLPLAHVALKKLREGIPELPPEKEFLYWYAILTVLLLLGPLTWTMNVIWLIPLSALAVARTPWSKEKEEKMTFAPWLLLVGALLLAFVPDCMYLGWRDFASPSAFCKALDSSKYIFSELFVIISLWLHIKTPTVMRTSETDTLDDESVA